MLVVSYNVAYHNSDILLPELEWEKRSPYIFDQILRTAPEVFLLQEVHSNYNIDPLREHYYVSTTYYTTRPDGESCHLVFGIKKSSEWCHTVDFVDMESVFNEARKKEGKEWVGPFNYQVITLENASQKIQLINTHFPLSKMRLAMAEHFGNQTYPNPTLIVGDMNCLKDIDGPRQLELMEKGTLVDAMPKARDQYGNTLNHSFECTPKDKMFGKLFDTWHIDRAFVSNMEISDEHFLVERPIECPVATGVQMFGASDHFMLVLNIDVK